MTEDNLEGRSVEDGKSGETFRLAVIGTPRSGNTWIRSMLSSFYDLKQIAPLTSDLILWDDLPSRCIIQIHEWPEPEFLRLIEANGIRVVSPARHPFDVLISWLNYYYYVHEDGLCTGGCNECVLVGASPGSEIFEDYVKGFHGRAVLGFTPWWWRRADVIRLRYEDLVSNPVIALNLAAEQIGRPFRRPVPEVIEATSIGKMKSSRVGWQYHFWQGRPGLWRSLITAAEARSIAANLQEPFESLKYACDPFAELGYACDPDPTLTPEQADRNWLQLQLDSTREHLLLEKTKHRATKGDLEASRGQIEAIDRLSVETRASLTSAEAKLVACGERLARVDEIGPTLLKFSQRIARSFRGAR